VQTELRSAALVAALFFFVFVPAAHAQAGGAPARDGAHAAEAVILRPGDLVRIAIWPDSGLGGQFQIEETGLLHLPGLGEVPVGGRSLDEVRRELRRRYAETWSNPVVTVTPVFHVSVLGSVVRPDVYEVRATETLLDVISRAGGLRPEANGRAITVIRQDREPQIASMEDAKHGAGLLTTPIRSGDLIIVPERRRLNFNTMVLGLQSVVLLISLLAR
jgi:polysaccharide biosynthesis/export protein